MVKLTEIVLADLGGHFHVGGYCGDDERDKINMHTPRDVNYLKGFVTGVIMMSENFSDIDSYVELTNDGVRNSNEFPMDVNVYGEVRDYVRAWSLGGVDD